MIILFIVALSIVSYLVLDYLMVDRVISKSHGRVMEKINGLVDGIKTFFTVTLVEKFSSLDSNKSDETDEFDI